MNDEIVEIRLQPDEVHRSSTVHPPDPCAPQAGGADPPVTPMVHQNVAVRRHGGLHDGHTLPRVLPEQSAAGGRDARDAGATQQQDLLDATDRHPVRRTVASCVHGADPARRPVATS